MLGAMSVAAVFDLHWEVKTNALTFWDHFVKSHLTDQGMLDDSFPNVTFSKEHRKIMALNETEIKRRLNKALDELARQSCLGVSNRNKTWKLRSRIASFISLNLSVGLYMQLKE